MFGYYLLTSMERYHDLKIKTLFHGEREQGFVIFGDDERQEKPQRR